MEERMARKIDTQKLIKAVQDGSARISAKSPHSKGRMTQFCIVYGEKSYTRHLPSDTFKK
jgi:hypothetical protein